MSSEWEVRSGTLVTHILWSEHTRVCPWPYWDASQLFLPRDHSKGKESIKKEKEPKGFKLLTPQWEKAKRDPRESKGVHCRSLFLSQRWGFQELVRVQTTQDRNS